jgi:tRNA dimethylallyltransferase
MINIKKQSLPFVLIISGPTACGKTFLSLKIAKEFDGEIINADMGQFYLPFSVGTAKPSWQKEEIKHHLFDIIDSPKSLTVCEYRDLVLEKINEVSSRKKLPILVGGSLFYIQSLFFPPVDFGVKKTLNFVDKNLKKEELSPWERLKEIDIDRAKELHPNDLYRINRALQIWEEFGVKPSLYKPKFNPLFNFHILFLNPILEMIEKNINERTFAMMKGENNWIGEVKEIIGSEWEDFLKEKKLIGYPQILDWIRDGEDPKTFNLLVEQIQKDTRNYAKRQLVFWKSFRKKIIINCFSKTFGCGFSQLKNYQKDANLQLFLKVLKDNLKPFLIHNNHS